MNGRLGMTGDSVDRGDSAVGKSYLPGKGYISIAAMRPVKGKKALKQAVEDRRKIAAEHVPTHARDNLIYANGPTDMSSRKRDLQGRWPKSLNPLSGAAQPNGRGGGKVWINPRANRPAYETMDHEMAHLKPKRNPRWLVHRTSASVKNGREEGRADFIANGKATPGTYIHPDKRHRRGYNEVQAKMSKVDVTMSDHEAKRLADKYDTRGPLPKGLDRPTKMKAYEARYVASGGKKNEKWHRRANAAEVSRNVGLAGATVSAAAVLAARGKRIRPLLKKVPGAKHLSTHRVEAVGLGSAALGGGSELYGEYARARRASYQNSPAGVAGSALSRMQGYTPGAKR